MIRFLKNQARKVEGLGYSGLETFKGDPYASCVRETGQNSMDARLGSDTVRIDIRLHDIDRDQIPFADELAEVVDACLRENTDERTTEHFESARHIVAAKVWKVLEISDSNTTGLTGPLDDMHSVFNVLVKGDGVTNKLDPTSAGSYGIGKNAAVAVSSLQCVIYSTAADAEGEQMFAAQGRVRAISHKRNDVFYGAEGFWGGEEFSAISKLDGVPSWMRRTVVGTSIFSVGFRQENGWEDRIKLAVLCNFVSAIDAGAVEFNVNGAIISRSTLDSQLLSPDLEESAVAFDLKSQLLVARRLLENLRSEISVERRIDDAYLGSFILRVLPRQGMPKSVHVIRNGIYITNNFKKFAQPMASFNGTSDFIAMLSPSHDEEGAKASRILKSLENPAHDAFEPDRIVEQAKRDQVRLAIKRVVEKIRALLKEIAKVDEGGTLQLDDLSEVLAANGGVGSPHTEPSDELDPVTLEYSDARRSTSKDPPPGAGRSGLAVQKGGADRSKLGGRQSSKGRGTGLGSREAMALEDVVFTMDSKRGPFSRRLHFTSVSGGVAKVSLHVSGLYGLEPLAIVSTSHGSIANGSIIMDLREGERVSIDVDIDEPYAGGVEVQMFSVGGAVGDKEVVDR